MNHPPIPLWHQTEAALPIQNLKKQGTNPADSLKQGRGTWGLPCP